jgi:uncharacterized protein
MSPRSIVGSDNSDPRRDSLTLPVRIALLLIRGYRLVLSPLFTGSCRFHPSCSRYAADAIRVHGVVRGAWLGARRLARCHPLGSAGFDPVPPRRS